MPSVVAGVRDVEASRSKDSEFTRTNSLRFLRIILRTSLLYIVFQKKSPGKVL